MTPYEEGYQSGTMRREDPTYDCRWDLADAAKRNVFAEFKRGLADGIEGKDPTP